MNGDKSASPRRAGRRRNWRVWTVAGGATAVAAAAVAYGIFDAGNPTDPLTRVAAAPPTGAAAEARLRSLLPPDLRSAKECVATTPAANALATITCVWAQSHVPRTATYSLFADKAVMLTSAKSIRDQRVRRGAGPGRAGGLDAQGTSCDSAEDFDDGGGKTTWRSDNRERGTIWCYLNKEGEPELTYTDSATTISSTAIAPAGQQTGQLAEQLLGWFREEGQPEPSPTPTVSAGSPSPSPSPSSEPSEGPTNGPTDGPTDGPGPTDPGPVPT